MTCGKSVVFFWYSCSSTNKTERHDITEILLKVALSTINQRGNQMPQSKKDRQYNGQKKKDKRANNDLRNTTQKGKDWATRIPLTNRGGIMCFGRVSSSCSNSDTFVMGCFPWGGQFSSNLLSSSYKATHSVMKHLPDERGGLFCREQFSSNLLSPFIRVSLLQWKKGFYKRGGLFGGWQYLFPQL